LDVLRALVGEPTHVTAAFQFAPGLDRVDYDCTLLLELQKGSTAEMHITSLPYSRRGPEHGGWLEEIEIDCEKGWVKLVNHTWDGSLPPSLQVYREPKKSLENLYTGETRQWENEMQHFVECVRLGCTPTPNVIDGYRVDQLIADAYRSGLENQKVQVAFRD
jgi:predicted dehydrogenase